MLRLEMGLPEQESASLEIMKTTASLVIPESGLEQEDIMMTPTRVETTHCLMQIMEINT